MRYAFASKAAWMRGDQRKPVTTGDCDSEGQILSNRSTELKTLESSSHLSQLLRITRGTRTHSRSNRGPAFRSTCTHGSSVESFSLHCSIMLSAVAFHAPMRSTSLLGIVVGFLQRVSKYSLDTARGAKMPSGQEPPTAGPTAPSVSCH